MDVASKQDVGLQESELIKELKQRNQQAFRVLVEQQKDVVYHTCLGFLHHPQDAEDVAQEVFIQIFESIQDFREDASLSTWIYRIAVTKSLELLRKRKRKKRIAYFKSILNLDADPDDYVDQQYFEHPGVAMENRERAEILFRTIDSLPDNQRIAFVLHRVEGLSYKKVAEVMETTLSAVESLIHRAKKNLQLRLKTYYERQDL